MKQSEVKKGKASDRALVARGSNNAAIDKTLQKMKAPLRAVFAKVARIVGKWDGIDLLVGHEIGTHVLEVRDHLARYGDDAVELLARALGVRASVLYISAKVAELWKRSELVALLERWNALGHGIGWADIAKIVGAGLRRTKSPRFRASSRGAPKQSTKRQPRAAANVGGARTKGAVSVQWTSRSQSHDEDDYAANFARVLLIVRTHASTLDILAGEALSDMNADWERTKEQVDGFFSRATAERSASGSTPRRVQARGES